MNWQAVLIAALTAILKAVFPIALSAAKEALEQAWEWAESWAEDVGESLGEKPTSEAKMRVAVETARPALSGLEEPAIRGLIELQHMAKTEAKRLGKAGKTA